MKSQNDPLYDTPAAADYLGCSPRTLEDKRYRGGGPKFLRCGRMIRYRKSDLDRFIDERFSEHNSTSEYADAG